MMLKPISRTELVEALRSAADQLIDMPATYGHVDWGYIEWRDSPLGLHATYSYSGGPAGHNTLGDLHIGADLAKRINEGLPLDV